MEVLARLMPKFWLRICLAYPARLDNPHVSSILRSQAKYWAE